MSTAGDENAQQITMEIDQQQVINNSSPIDSMLSPLLLSSLSDLRNLGNSLSDFLRHWDDLHLTLNSVLSAIDAQSDIRPTPVKKQTHAQNNNSEIESKQNNSPMETQNQAQKSNSENNSSIAARKDSATEIGNQNHAQKNDSEDKSITAEQNNPNRAQKTNSKSKSSTVEKNICAVKNIQDKVQGKNSDISQNQVSLLTTTGQKNEMQSKNSKNNQNQVSLSMADGHKDSYIISQNQVHSSSTEQNKDSENYMCQKSTIENQNQVPVSTGSGENKKSSKKVNEAQSNGGENKNSNKKANEAQSSSSKKSENSSNNVSQKSTLIGGGEGEKLSGDDVAKGKDRLSELISICEREDSKALEKFVRANVSDIEWLRREVPAAIERSKAPAKLILFAMNKFYRHSISAFDNEKNPVVLNRRVSILLLEFYVVSGCCSLNLERSVMNSADGMALAWMRRMIKEGGVERAKAVDALGLVLFMACFGIPKDFDSKDIYHLLLLINLKKKADVLQKSPAIREKIPDIIQDLLKKQMHPEAVNLICVFGLKEKFPPLPLLSSFLQKVTEAEGQEERERTPIAQKDFNEKQLAKLRSVLDCLENNKLDYHEFASFNISQRINKLVSDISMAKPKTNLKRKHEDLGAPDAHQAKQPLPASNEQQQMFSVPEAYRGNFSQQKPVKDTLMALQVSRMDLLAQNMTMSPGAGMNTLPATGTPPFGGGPTMRTNLVSMTNSSGFGTMLIGATHAGSIIGNSLGPIGNINEARSHSLSAAAAPHVEGPNLGSSYGTRTNINGARSGSLSAVGAAHDRVTMGNNLRPWTNINVGSGQPVLSETGAGHARLTPDHIVSSMRTSHGGVGNSGPMSVGVVHTGALTMGNNLGSTTSIIGGAKTNTFLSTSAVHGASLAGISSNAIGATGPSCSGGMTTGNNLGVSYGQPGHGVDAERLARGPLAPGPYAAWSDTHRPSGSFFQPPASFPVTRTEKTDLYDFADSVLEHESSYYGKLGKNR